MKCGSVGLRYPQFECEIMDPYEKGMGEIVTRGRLGYILEKKMRQQIHEDGSAISTIRRRDKGFLFIEGRPKEILVTGGGGNVAPVPIEDAIKADAELSEIISHAMLQRKHLAVVITLKMVLNKQNQPTANLRPDVTEWL